MHRLFAKIGMQNQVADWFNTNIPKILKTFEKQISEKICLAKKPGSLIRQLTSHQQKIVENIPVDEGMDIFVNVHGGTLCVRCRVKYSFEHTEYFERTVYIGTVHEDGTLTQLKEYNPMSVVSIQEYEQAQIDAVELRKKLSEAEAILNSIN